MASKPATSATLATSKKAPQQRAAVRLAASRTAEGRTRVVMLSSAVALGPGLAPTMEQKRPAIGQDHSGPLEAAAGVAAPSGSGKSSDGKCRSWIMLLPQGQYNEPRYGKLNITPDLLRQLKQTFDARVRQIDIALDEDHDAGKATGWLEAVEVRPAGMTADGCAAPAGLWGLVRWTALGEADLRGELYRYFSIEYGPYKDIVSGKKYPNVIWGGGLTNRPVMKRMPAVALSEGSQTVSRKPWSSVKKSELPRSCFLIQGDPSDKATWKLPIYEGAGPKDAAGHYTKRGALNLNAVRAAIAALGGARTGSPMQGVPSGTKARLERLLARYGNGKSTQAAASGSRAKTQQHSEGTRQVPTSRNKKVEDELDEELEFAGEEDADDETFAFDDGSGDMADEMYDEQDGGPDADEGEDGDGSEDEGTDGDEFDAKSDTHGAMTTKGHSHGKYAEHSHDGDANHSEAEMKRGRKKASESRGHTHSRETAAKSLSEQVRILNERLAAEERANEEMRYALYEGEVGKTLDGWRNQTFQFKEGRTRDGKPVVRSGKIAMSKTFSDAYKGFMLKDAIRMPKATRTKLNELVEMALSTAIVDLSARGSAFDQESRRTLKAGERGGMASESDQIEQTAQRLLSEMGKSLKELDPAAQLALYERAEKEIRASR